MTTDALFGIASGVMWTREHVARQKYPSAGVHWEIMGNEDHFSIPARAISAGYHSICRARPGVHEADFASAFGQGRQAPEA